MKRIMKRIMIIGCGGAGKSTLSRQLAEKLELPLYHLDVLFWKPGWVESDREEFFEKLKKFSAEEKWISDGNYIKSIPILAEKADTIIYLDMPIPICFIGALKRNFSKKERPDMAEGCAENFDMKFFWWILTFRKHTAPRIEKILAGNKDKNIIVLKSRKAVKDFLNNILNNSE